MVLPKLKLIDMPPFNPNLTTRENEECEQYVYRVNCIRSIFNKFIECLNKFIWRYIND